MIFAHIKQNILAPLQQSDIPLRDIARIAWSLSTLSAHPESMQNIYWRKAPFSTPRPQLAFPETISDSSYTLPRYFSKGSLDLKTPRPISYLLIETRERAKARPVPGNSLLLRSLCKGKGVLKRTRQDFVYLDIENHFINAMLPFLKVQGLSRPPYFNLFAAPEGAHIPIIPAREAAFQYLTDIEELGREFSFEIEGLYSLEPTLWPEVEQVWFFQVRSSELETLRRRYFLPEKPCGHPFHIAVAVKLRPTQSRSSQLLPTMRVSAAFLPA